MDEMSLGDESDAEPMPTDMLEEIPVRIQSHLSINRRVAYYRICYCIKKRQTEWKGA